MLARSLQKQILQNDALTRGLGDEEARVLIEWLVDYAEALADLSATEDKARQDWARWCRRARAIVRFVTLWCHEGQRGAAGQLLVTERFHWPLPPADVDPCELMTSILAFETTQIRQSFESAA